MLAFIYLPLRYTMKTSLFIKALIAASFTAISFGVNAATIQLGASFSYFTPACGPGNTATVETVVNINDYMPGASQGYYVSDAKPNALDGSHLQLVLDAVGSGFSVTNFTKLDP